MASYQRKCFHNQSPLAEGSFGPSSDRYPRGEKGGVGSPARHLVSRKRQVEIAHFRGPDREKKKKKLLQALTTVKA